MLVANMPLDSADRMTNQVLSCCTAAAQVQKRQVAGNAVFWLVVLTLKCLFDWYWLIAPLDEPMHALWRRGFLRQGHSGPRGDILLCMARGLPAFMLSLVDTGIAYSVSDLQHQEILIEFSCAQSH